MLANMRSKMLNELQMLHETAFLTADFPYDGKDVKFDVYTQNTFDCTILSGP